MNIEDNDLKKKRLVYRMPTIQKINITQTKSGRTLMMQENLVHSPNPPS